MENHLKTFAQGKLKYLFLLISLAMEIGTDIAHVLRSLLTIIFLVVYKEFQITGIWYILVSVLHHLSVRHKMYYFVVFM